MVARIKPARGLEIARHRLAPIALAREGRSVASAPLPTSLALGRALPTTNTGGCTLPATASAPFGHGLVHLRGFLCRVRTDHGCESRVPSWQHRSQGHVLGTKLRGRTASHLGSLQAVAIGCMVAVPVIITANFQRLDELFLLGSLGKPIPVSHEHWKTREGIIL